MVIQYQIYAPEILLSQDLILENDTLHYTRTIGNNEDEYTKCIFGFKSETMYNKIIQDMDGKYEVFRKDMNHINESILVLETNTLLYKAKYIYEAFWKMHYEEGYNEITPKLYRLLKHAVTILNRNKEHVQYLGNIEEILNDFVILKLHKF